MTLKLSKEQKDQIVATSYHAPRSVLGFHEYVRPDKSKIWVVRVMEPDASEVSLFWEDQKMTSAFLTPLTQIHPGGLFEATITPRAQLVPYRLKVTYKNGIEEVKYDPFFFSTQLTDYDCFLFNEGNHHRIYRKLGAHLTTLDGVPGTLFAVWAPSAKRVSVVGTFNLWDGRKHPMQAIGSSGIWELFIPEVGVGTVYKYEVKTQTDALLLKADPYAFGTELRPATASVVTDLSTYTWNDQNWIAHREKHNPLQAPINIYEIHLGSWKRVPEENDRFLTYREAAEELIPYVKELGYTHIELLPIAEHPFDGSWGYQVTGYYAPTARFGSPQDFMYFVDQCHQNEIGVIVDWVPAHFPKDAHGLAQFDGTAVYEHADPRQGEHKDWGTLIFNFGRHEVRNFLIANALFWLEYYHIDGLRVDAVASMLYLDYSRKEGEWVPNEFGGRENLHAVYFMRNLNETLFHYYPGVLTIAEESTAWPGVSRPTYTGGLGFNFKWNMGWMNDTLRYMAKDPVYRRYDHHLMTFSLMYAFSENFVLSISHDEVVHGKRSLLDKMPGDLWQKMANYRTYLTFMIGHPGKKLLFMGSEFGQWREWSEARSLDWHLLDHAENRQLFEFSKALNWFYRQHPALFTNDFDWSGFEWIDLHDQQNSIISFMRKGATDCKEPLLIFVFNFTPVPRDGYQVGAPLGGNYRKVFDSDAREFGGSGYSHQEIVPSEPIECQGRANTLRLDIPPLGVVVLQPEA